MLSHFVTVITLGKLDSERRLSELLGLICTEPTDNYSGCCDYDNGANSIDIQENRLCLYYFKSRLDGQF